MIIFLTKAGGRGRRSAARALCSAAIDVRRCDERGGDGVALWARLRGGGRDPRGVPRASRQSRVAWSNEVYIIGNIFILFLESRMHATLENVAREQNGKRFERRNRLR